MARPRTPSNVLELRGAFKKHPERRRAAVQPAGEFDTNPPAHLPQEQVRAWRAVVAQIPPGVLTASDGLSVEIMAGLMSRYWLTGELDYVKELRMWFGQYGLTGAGREKITAKPKPASNPFSEA